MRIFNTQILFLEVTWLLFNAKTEPCDCKW